MELKSGGVDVVCVCLCGVEVLKNFITFFMFRHFWASKEKARYKIHLKHEKYLK